jgi:quercetin dioxygenase-like cupin family protein
MIRDQRRSKMAARQCFVSYGAVAITAAVLSSVATWGAMNLSAAAFAQAQPPAGTIPLLNQPLADLPGREVRMTLLDRVPGNASVPHRHPGHHTFGYVVEGTYELGVNNQPTRMLKAGDTFYEPPGTLHSVSRNAGNTQLKIVVFMVADARNPSTVNEK